MAGEQEPAAGQEGGQQVGFVLHACAPRSFTITLERKTATGWVYMTAKEWTGRQIKQMRGKHNAGRGVTKVGESKSSRN